MLVKSRYELGPVIGVGSSAVVRRARDLLDRAPVAIKQFRPGANPSDARRHQQEIATLARLCHPGLVRMRDSGVQDGAPFVVTDLAEGPTLAERLRAGPPLTSDAVRRIGRQLGDALAYVHACGIVHRDVKPANILLERGLRPRLADFGIAIALDRTATTANGCVIGTAAYLAPEQVRGEQVGPPADVYALGLVLLEALTARREYTGGPVEVALARLWRPPVVPDGLPADLAALLHAMTRAEPAERPTAAEVAAALAPRRPASTAARHGRHRRRTAPQLTTALVAGAAAVAAVASVASADQRAPERVSGSADVVQVHRLLR